MNFIVRKIFMILDCNPKNFCTMKCVDKKKKFPVKAHLKEPFFHKSIHVISTRGVVESPTALDKKGRDKLTLSQSF